MSSSVGKGILFPTKSLRKFLCSKWDLKIVSYEVCLRDRNLYQWIIEQVKHTLLLLVPEQDLAGRYINPIC